jgi:hypothetical protein
MLNQVNTVYGMTVRGRPTFAPGNQDKTKVVEYSIKIQIAHTELRQGGYQYFSWHPVGFSEGFCGHGCSRTDSIIDLVELKK